MKGERSPLDEAKERLTIPVLWERLGLPGQARRYGRSPFREDRTPSFSVYADGRRWRDFATGSGGDAADFLACALDVPPREGVRRLIAMAGTGQDSREHRSPVRRIRGLANIPGTSEALATRSCDPKGSAEQAERAVKRARWPVMEPCTAADMAVIAERRGLTSEGVALAARRGLLWMADSQEGRAWVLTDSRRVNAQARRLDGLPWESLRGAKARTLPGSEASWPLGLAEAAAYPAIALVEGGPDLLAACLLLEKSGVADLVAPVAMLGAGMSIPGPAVPLFAGKRVRIFAHPDTAGQEGARRWYGQLRRSARYVDGFTPTVGDLNDFVCREGEDLAAAWDFTKGLPPRRESPEEAESRRVAGELARMQRAGAITGPDDPEAPLCAAVIRLFGARFDDRIAV